MYVSISNGVLALLAAACRLQQAHTVSTPWLPLCVPDASLHCLTRGISTPSPRPNVCPLSRVLLNKKKREKKEEGLFFLDDPL